MNPLNISLLAWNIIVFFLYGIDKLCARSQARRVRERTLLLCAMLAGGLGALFGMVIFNHKTSKPKFRYTVPVLALLLLVFLYYEFMK
ncbi:MAG: DUF1294 domain-containing protein [Ruminococcaceae bacterium]|nr:DUF1294 domain-containing protein [Oscillospiraceae bacterium]